MKTKEELNELKQEVEALQGKLAELSEEALTQVAGGKVIGMRNTSVSFDDCPQGEEFDDDLCKACKAHRDVCWPTGMIQPRELN